MPRKICFHGGYFNPRPPWGGRQNGKRSCCCYAMISIHALRGEGDAQLELVIFGLTAFQSTPSVGRATLLLKRSYRWDYFNPRPPWGGRR